MRNKIVLASFLLRWTQILFKYMLKIAKFKNIKIHKL